MSSVFICRCHEEGSQGARVPDGLSEWQLAPAINEAMRDQVWLAGRLGVRLDKGTLTSRVDTINFVCADRDPKRVLPPFCAVEVHCNSADDPARRGFFVMAHRTSKRGQDMARAVVNTMSAVPGIGTNKGINRVDSRRQWLGTDWMYDARRQYFVCETVCPAILVECCFLSNQLEAAWISKRANRSRLGKAVGLGIAEYMKGVSK